MNNEITKALVRAMMENPYEFEWTIQGFGMLRMYPDPEHVFRLNIWDERYRTVGVSMVHNHPWHFTSKIIVGVVHQYRYQYINSEYERGEFFHRQVIRTGEGGGPVSRPVDTVELIRQGEEIYEEGEYYSQNAKEVHISLARNGTVTLNKREMVDKESHAYTFWPAGLEWVSAEPRTATREEIEDITRNSIETWF